MAEEVQNENNPQNVEAAAVEETGQDDVFSLEDIDKLIAEDNPEFLDSLNEIKDSEEMKNAEIEMLEGVGDDIEDESESSQKPKSKVAQFKVKFKERYAGKIKKVFAPLKKLTEPFKHKISNLKANFHRRKLALRNNIILFLKESLLFLKTELPERIKYYKKVLGEQINSLKASIADVRYWPLKKKMAMVLIMPVLGVTFFLIYLTIKSGWLPSLYTPLLSGMNQVADEEFKYDRSKELIELFKAFPQPDFSVQLDKVIVNLQQSQNSSNTPMATFQVYLKLNSQDTGIEVMHRQKEIIDLMSRAAEEFSYDELNSQIGKERLKSSLKHVINEVLNQGRVESIFFKFIIIKP